MYLYLLMYINITFVKLRPHADIYFMSKFLASKKKKKIFRKKINLKQPNYFIDFEKNARKKNR